MIHSKQVRWDLATSRRNTVNEFLHKMESKLKLRILVTIGKISQNIEAVVYDPESVLDKNLYNACQLVQNKGKKDSKVFLSGSIFLEFFTCFQKLVPWVLK